MYLIQMKDGTNWVTLGGRWSGDLVALRMSQFREHYMRRAIAKRKDSELVDGREFRAVKI
jgi:hypothetical protein